MCKEVSPLLLGRAVLTVEPAASEEGFIQLSEANHNLKGLNFRVDSQHFKIEGIHTLQEIVAWDEWLAKLDLKDAYFTVPVTASTSIYLW